MSLGSPGDEVLVRPTDKPGVRIISITGDGGRLPLDPRRNAAGAAAQAVLAEAGDAQGIELELTKGLPFAAGMGGSGASAVAGAVAVNGLLESGLSQEALFCCALQGEEMATGAAAPDNVAASLVGGVVLVPAWEAVRVIGLPVPEELTAVLVHPHAEVETAAARRALGERVSLRDATVQWGNTAALVAGLFRNDWDLIARSVDDRVAEPLRADAVPAFHQVKKAALEAGALAASLSGAGPSVFALCRGRERAQSVGGRMAAAFLKEAGLESDVFFASGNTAGARILER
jgi:homoserine kinase